MLEIHLNCNPFQKIFSATAYGKSIYVYSFAGIFSKIETYDLLLKKDKDFKT